MQCNDSDPGGSPITRISNRKVSSFKHGACWLEQYVWSVSRETFGSLRISVAVANSQGDLKKYMQELTFNLNLIIRPPRRSLPSLLLCPQLRCTGADPFPIFPKASLLGRDQILLLKQAAEYSRAHFHRSTPPGGRRPLAATLPSPQG